MTTRRRPASTAPPPPLPLPLLLLLLLPLASDARARSSWDPHDVQDGLLDLATPAPAPPAVAPFAVAKSSAGGTDATDACADTPGWIDSHGDGCAYYSFFQACEAEGAEGDGGMGVAMDNCCACGGGLAPGEMLRPTPSPIAAVAPFTVAKSSAGGTDADDECADTPGWIDSFGDGCGYYSSVQVCEVEGVEGDGGMGVAMDNCCACGGGLAPGETLRPTPSPTPWPTRSPTPGPTGSPTPRPEWANPGGTCGGGDRGNGLCRDGTCCSKYGMCGTTPADCDGLTLAPTQSPSKSPTDPPTSSPTTSEPTVPVPTHYPTSSPSGRDWSAITPGHTSFCGPKVVGGYEIAKSTCSLATECGKGAGANSAYGSSGNDCPKGSMCFNGIACERPTTMPSASPTDAPTASHRPTAAPSAMPSAEPSASAAPTPLGQTRPPTAAPTAATGRPTTTRRAPTAPPYRMQNSITTRGSFCGATFADAVFECSPDRSCAADGDCDGDEECFVNISCTFDASKATGAYWEEDVEGSAEGDDLYGTEFESDGGKKFEEAYAAGDSSARRGWWACSMFAVVIASIALIV